MSHASRYDHAALACLLRELVSAQEFGAGASAFPSIDLAVACFPAGGKPVYANVLFSREHPEGVEAAIAPGAGAAAIHYLADSTDASGHSWLWDAPAWPADLRTLRAAPGAPRVVAPYPASLVKTMFAVGVALAVDRSRARWDAPHVHGGVTRTVAAWCERMLAISCNDATSAVVALLHRAGLLAPDGGALQQALHGWGLDTLRVEDTSSDGGWRNADGCGVGHLQMSAWDALRLFWLLDADAPPAPWLPAGAELPSAQGVAVLRGMLERQGLHTVLSATSLAGLPRASAGIPARVAGHWLTAKGGAHVEPFRFPRGVAAASSRAEVRFAHKTGTTDNYLSDAGIVRALRGSRHYLVAMTSSLGRRRAPEPLCATTWKVPALGASLDLALKQWLEPN